MDWRDSQYLLSSEITALRDLGNGKISKEYYIFNPYLKKKKSFKKKAVGYSIKPQ